MRRVDLDLRRAGADAVAREGDLVAGDRGRVEGDAAGAVEADVDEGALRERLRLRGLDHGGLAGAVVPAAHVGDRDRLALRQCRNRRVGDDDEPVDTVVADNRGRAAADGVAGRQRDRASRDRTSRRARRLAERHVEHEVEPLWATVTSRVAEQRDRLAEGVEVVDAAADEVQVHRRRRADAEVEVAERARRAAAPMRIGARFESRVRALELKVNSGSRSVTDEMSMLVA